MSVGSGFPRESSLVVAEVSYMESELGSEVSSLVGFLPVGLCSGVGSAEGGLLRES